MSKKTLIEAIIAALLIAVEVIVIVVSAFTYSLRNYDFYIMYLLAIFTNIDVIYGVILLIINSKTDESHKSNKTDENNKDEIDK